MSPILKAMGDDMAAIFSGTIPVSDHIERGSRFAHMQGAHPDAASLEYRRNPNDDTQADFRAECETCGEWMTPCDRSECEVCIEDGQLTYNREHDARAER